jgi:hypothetical protein
VTCDRLERDGLLADLDRDDEHVAGCPDCSARREEYRRLTAAIARGDTTHRPHAGWKERTLARVRAAQVARRRRARLLGGAVLAAAAAALLFFFVRRGPAVAPPPRLALRIAEGGGVWRGDAHPGNQLVVSASGGAPRRRELRIYRDGRELLLRCPGAPAPACRPVRGGVEVVWTIPTAGEYQVLWLGASTPLPDTSGSLDHDVRALTAAGGTVEAVETLRVD